MVFTFGEYRNTNTDVVESSPVEEFPDKKSSMSCSNLLFYVLGAILIFLLISYMSFPSFNTGPCSANKAKVSKDIKHPKTEEELESMLKDCDCAVILFHADWCGFCQKFMPEFEEAAKMPTDVVFISIDAGDGKTFAHTMQKLDIKGFPTMLLHKQGEPPKTYNGERSAQGVADFIKTV